MRRVWELKKKSLTQAANEFSERSPVLDVVGIQEVEAEWRAMVLFHTQTLAQRPDGTIKTATPVLIGIRYHERFLSEVPHPCEIVTVLQPVRIFHPNCNPAGAMCLGHPTVGIGLDAILHQVWAGLNYNMRIVNTRPYEILNPAAANFVRSNAERFPLSVQGIFEQAKG